MEPTKIRTLLLMKVQCGKHIQLHRPALLFESFRE